MDDNRRYEAFVRNRITELREQKGVSEHRMSLELGKSGSYIRSITNGISMPSLRELFNIMEYFDLTPTLFFAPMDDPDSLRGIIPQGVPVGTSPAGKDHSNRGTPDTRREREYSVDRNGNFLFPQYSHNSCGPL